MVVATASEEYYSEPASNAVDGSSSTYWTTNGGMAAWLMLDYGSSVAMGDYTIYPRSDGLSYRNPASWTWQGSAAGATITASSQYNTGTYAAINVVDGNTATRWAGASGTVPEWLQFHIPPEVVTPVTAYTITGYAPEIAGCPKTWTFSGSDDASTWTTLDTQTGITFSGSTPQTFTFANTTVYAYYRLNITATQSPDFVRVAEFSLNAGMGTMWTTLDTQTGYSWTLGAPSTFPCANTTAYQRYRLNITTNTNGSGYTSLAELSAVVSVAGQGALRRPLMVASQAAQRASRW